MLNLYIFGGCECWLTEKTYSKLTYEAPVDRAYRLWIETRSQSAFDVYSDLHKDAYGVRPKTTLRPLTD